MANLLQFIKPKGVQMKKVILILILALNTQVHAQTFFAEINQSVEFESSANSSLSEARRILTLFSRLSVYALMCGDSEDNTQFSNHYRSLFTEENRGMVRYNGNVFRNPIETLRNQAMLRYNLERDNLGGSNDLMCSKNRPVFDNFIYMNSAQIKEFSKLSAASEAHYLQAVLNHSAQSVQVESAEETD